MLNKVLVFESDPTFAGELRSEFGHLGCTTTIVEDGNVGLLQAVTDRPDLILLSIELPRTNGFSVCNKLKKDPSLKDVPLIIMSSESSDETFDQHKKLRWRAEDYVHKPIAFGELLEHIRAFVEVNGRSGEPEGAILIEDEIEVGSADYLLEEDSPIPAEEPAPASGGRRLEAVDEDVDAFAESAFGRLTGISQPPSAFGVHARSNGASAVEPAPPSPSRASMAPATGARTNSARPPPSGLDTLEHERVKGDLTLTRQRLQDTERGLDDAMRELGKLRLEAGDSAQLMREIDELRVKLAAAPKSGGTSSRDFLDLREALNKKDKEILVFREYLSKKDREIVEAQDRTLVLERSRADVEERLLGVERELAEVRDRGDVITQERDAARKSSEEFRARLDRAKAEGDSKDRQVAELRAKQADDRMANEAKLAAVRAEADQVIANERAEHARSLDHAEQRRGADLEQARRDRDTSLSDARQFADREKQDALTAQFAQLRQEHEAVLVTVRRTQSQEIERVRGEAALHEQTAVEALRAQHEEAMRAISEDRDARIVSLEARASRDRSDALDRIAQVEAELAAIRAEYQSVVDAKRKDDEVYEAHIVDLDQRVLAMEAARQEVQGHYEAATLRITTLATELDATRRDMTETTERLTLLTALSERARAKADADRQSLERAKDALAVALTQIEETEADRPG